jgi:UDP-glucose 4-epimerase
VKVLVTGGSGFIGRNLRTSLAPRYDLLAPTRRELDLLDGAAVLGYLERHRPDAIVHAATTPGHRNAPPAPDLAGRNVRMFLNLYERRKLWGRMVVLGSGLEYDPRAYAPKMTEELLGRSVPEDPTGLSKLACARIGRGDPGIVHLLPFGVFGPHEDWEIRFISNSVCKALFDLPITLRQNRRFDYVCVDDLCRVVEHFLVSPGWRSDVFNVTPDASVELLDLARLVLDVCGKDLPVVVAREGMGPEYSGDNSRLKAEVPGLDFRPLREAVTALRDWYRANLGLVRREALLVDK